MNTMHASTLGVNDISWFHGQLPKLPHTKAVDFALYNGQLLVLRIVAIAHISSSLALDDVVDLFGADVLVRAFCFAGGDRDLVKEDDGATKLALQKPTHLDDVFVAAAGVVTVHQRIEVTHM